MRRSALLFLVLGVGCAGSGTAANDDSSDAGTKVPTSSTGASPTSSAPPPPRGPSSPLDAGVVDAGYPLTYRSSLSVCWTDAKCNRALAISHGGDWSLTGAPYMANAALNAAFDHGSDGIKIDVRITSDGVAVLSHSSPIEYYESVDCGGKKIEEMTATDVTACHRFPTKETYQRLDDVLNAFRGKLVVQLCVKLATDTAKIAAAVLALNAQDFAFLELDASDVLSVVPPIPNNDKLWYLAQINQPSDVDALLGAKNPRAFMYEFAPTDTTVANLVTTKLHPAGIKSFTYNKDTASADQVKTFFTTDGFDVVSTDATAFTVDARKQVNTARGVSPP